MEMPSPGMSLAYEQVMGSQVIKAEDTEEQMSHLHGALTHLWPIHQTLFVPINWGCRIEDRMTHVPALLAGTTSFRMTSPTACCPLVSQMSSQFESMTRPT